MTRLTDNDRHFGPITYARTDWRAIRLVLSSGDREESDYAQNTLTAYAFGWCARINLPRILKPFLIRHKAASWTPETISRLGRDWYEETFPREYGFNLNEGHLILYLGAQTHDSRTTQSWSKFLPWTQWRHVRFSLYNASGRLFWEQKQRDTIRGFDRYDAQHEAEKKCPSHAFLLRDYDGAEVVATTQIHEREWHFGEGWFKWLSLFRKPMVKRSLNISFNTETGTEKGSWKGGTMGASIEMQPRESHESAMRRYCANEHRAKNRNYRMEYVGFATGAKTAEQLP